MAGFPEDRGVWLAVATVVTMLLGWLVMQRGPYGGPMSGAGAVVRTLLLLILAALPLAALLWAWRRLSKRARRVVPIPLGVLVVLLGLLAMAHSNIFAERVRMSRDPARQAAAAFADGNTRFWAVQDSTNALLAPPIVNRCLVNKYGVREISGTGGMTVNRAHARYRTLVAERAEAYNQAMIQRLRIPADEVARPADGYCPD